MVDEKELARWMRENPDLKIDTSSTAVRDEPKPIYDVNEEAGRLFVRYGRPEAHIAMTPADSEALKLFNITAVGDITKAGLDFKSKTEREVWYEWLPTIEYVRAEYEPMNLKVAGANYTPDIVLLRPDGRIWFIEVKGAGGWKAYKSGRSSRRSLKQCSRYYAWLGDFYLLMKIPKKDGGGWHFEQY